MDTGADVGVDRSGIEPAPDRGKLTQDMMVEGCPESTGSRHTRDMLDQEHMRDIQCDQKEGKDDAKATNAPKCVTGAEKAALVTYEAAEVLQNGDSNCRPTLNVMSKKVAESTAINQVHMSLGKTDWKALGESARSLKIMEGFPSAENLKKSGNPGIRSVLKGETLLPRQKRFQNVLFSIRHDKSKKPDKTAKLQWYRVENLLIEERNICCDIVT
eukprot:271324-Rhodomonas_salina.1